MKASLLSIHHIGIVVSDIESTSKFYEDKLGYTLESEIIHEINQKVFVQFMILGDCRVELIQPAGPDSPVYGFLQKGGGLAHICYETDDIETSISFFRKEYRAILTYHVNWSTSLSNCKYAFLARHDGEVIELVQFFN